MFSNLRVAALAAIGSLLFFAPAAAAQAAPGTPVTQITTDAQSAVLTPLAPLPLDIQALPTNPTSAATNVQPAIAERVRPDRSAQPTSQLAPRRAVAAEGALSRRPLDELVAEHRDTPVGDVQFECLASAVYFESRGEPLEGQLAVAEVILNRVASGRFRATICDVVTQPSQFSFVRRGQIPQAPRQSAAWQRAVAIAHIAMQNLHDVTGDNSLFFHATYVRPSWGRASARIARIGNHVFYR